MITSSRCKLSTSVTFRMRATRIFVVYIYRVALMRSSPFAIRRIPIEMLSMPCQKHGRSSLAIHPQSPGRSVQLAAANSLFQETKSWHDPYRSTEGFANGSCRRLCQTMPVEECWNIFGISFLGAMLFSKSYNPLIIGTMLTWSSCPPLYTCYCNVYGKC